MNTTVKTLTTVAALGADAAIANGFLYVTGLDPMLIAGIKPTSIIAPVTEVLQVTTYTPVAANSTEYILTVTYTNKFNGNIESKIFSYTSDATATATEIGDYFRSAINDSVQIPIAATGTTTLILTAETGNYSAQAQFATASVGAGTLTFAATTAAVIGVGKGIFIKGGQYAEETAMALIVDASYYYQAEMKYANGDLTGSSQKVSPLANINVLYVLSTATNVETLVGVQGTLTQALSGYQTVYVAGTGTLAATAATDLLTLAGGGEFAAQSIVAGDVLFQDGETTYYTVNNVISTTTANSVVAADNGAASYTIIHKTRL